MIRTRPYHGGGPGGLLRPPKRKRRRPILPSGDGRESEASGTRTTALHRGQRTCPPRADLGAVMVERHGQAKMMGMTRSPPRRGGAEGWRVPPRV
jgi:hypothetical protein